MLLRLLKSIAVRRRAHVAASPVAGPAGRSAPSTPAGSRLQLLSRLASFASGVDIVVSGEEPPFETPAGGRERQLPVMEIVRHAATLRGSGDVLQDSTARCVRDYAAAFSDAARPGHGINVFAFHVDLPKGAGIDYVDAKFSPAEFDYRDILTRFIARVRAHCPGAMIYLVSSPGSRYRSLAAADVAVVELPVEPAHPMYERAIALLAYAESAAFVRNTVFLDSDAFVNRPLDEVFALGFDVGLTYRDGPSLMPVNEGALFLAAERPHAVREFLRRRLALYDRLLGDTVITDFYGDVRRWRGGQLSLNAVAHDFFPCSPYRAWELAGARLRLLPCDTYNFAAGEGEADSSLERLEQRYVVHFKGPRKYALAFAARAERAVAQTR